MAKRKGKSKRRNKQWQKYYEHGEAMQDEHQSRQKVRQAEIKIPSQRLEAQEENLDELDRLEGMVISLYRGGVAVKSGDRELLCGIAKAFRPPEENATAIAPGDIVTVALTADQHVDGEKNLDKDRADGLIVARRPRESALLRPTPWSAKRRAEYEEDVPHKVIAANMDVLLIVSSVRQPRFRRNFIDRFLIVAERGELTPVLVVNKIDIKPLEPELVEDFVALGVKIHQISALTGQGVQELRSELIGHRSVLAGQSGVGKTTLINAIFPEANATTKRVRMKDERGRHTTSSTKVYELPEGGLILDTPGIRELGFNMDAGELWWYFPEFEPHAMECRFNNCTHTHEPGCAVIEAVEDGEIPERRYESYLRIYDTLTEQQG